MPIRIKCPSCQTILGVKESLAGKKANCPKCRFVLTIPMPKAPVAAPVAPPPPAQDAEALAASTFADEPPPVEKPASTQTIEFDCPFCAETVKVSVDLCGKQTPCTNPDCKRIVKVPLLKEDKPKDWRQADPRGPSGALKKDANVPEGAWSTAQKTRVSTESLEEADAIPVKKEPVTAAMWVKRGALAAVVLLAAVAAWWGGSAWIAGKRLHGTFNNAMEAVDKAKPAPVQAAAIQRGAGEFYVKLRQAPKAMDHFGKARGLLLNTDKKDLERDAVLTGLAVAMVDLGGNDSEVLDKERLEWEEVQKQLMATLLLLSCNESKQTAMREVGRKLLARDQSGIALFLTNQLAAPPPEEQAAPPEQPKEGEEPPPKKEAKKQPLVAQQIGFRLLLKDNAEAKQILEPPTKVKEGISDPIVRLAYAEGRACEGNFTEARAIATAKDADDTPADPLDRIEASLAVAAVALQEKKPLEARANLDDALKLFKSKDMKKEDKARKPGLLVQLARVAAQLEMPAEVRMVVEYLPEKEKAAKDLALLEMATVQIDAAATPVQVSLLDELAIAKDSLAYGLGLTRIARHNTRLGNRSDALALAEGLDDRLQAFVYMGVALGMVDGRK